MKFVRGTGAAVVALLATAAFAPSASARGVVVEDWLGSSGFGWQQGSATDFLGCASASSDGSFSFAQADASGRESLVSEAQFLPQQGPGTGEWRFRAPGTSTIVKAEYGPAYFTKEGCLNEGVRLADGSWQATRNARAGDAQAASVHPTACGANGTVTGAPVTTKDGSTAVTITGAPSRQTFCSSAGCGIEGSPTGNQAVFGAERIKQGRPGFGVVLPGARLTLTDYDAPKITSATNSHPRWVRSARGSVSVTATDTGLGVKSATVTHAALSGDATTTQTHPCSGDRADRCPATWNTARPDWTTSWPYDTDQMPEGVQPYGVAVRDIVDNRTPDSGYDTSSVPPSKIDRSDPTDIIGTGQVPDLDGKWFLGNDARTITASAHDTYSGVQQLQIETTDGTVLDHATFDCSGDQCPRDVTKTLAVDTTKLPEGDTVVRLRATDLVGNTAVGRTWTLRIDRSDPTDIAGTGSLPDSDGVWTLGNDTRTVNATAHDRYSGVKTLALETIDGHTIDSKTFTCDSGRQCNEDDTATLVLDLNSLPEGDTQVRLRATDLLDHASVGPTWTLRVDRSDPEVPEVAGPALDARNTYVRGDVGLDLTASDRDAWSGLASLRLVRASAPGGELARLDESCGSHGCPRAGNARWTVQTADLPEGTNSLRVTATDLLGHERSAAAWEIYVDRSGPTAPSGLALSSVDEEQSTAELSFDGASDPDSGDVRGSGVAVTEYRYGVNGAPESDWAAVSGRATLTGVADGDTVNVEVRATDAVGNVGSVATAAFRAAAPPMDAVYSSAANSFLEDTFGMSEADAAAWMDTQARALDLDDALQASGPSSYDSLWFDIPTRRVHINVLGTASLTAYSSFLHDRGLESQVVFDRIPYSTGQLLASTDDARAALADDIASGLVQVGYSPGMDQVNFEIAASADSGVRGRVAAAAQALPAGQADIANSSDDTFQFERLKCGFGAVGAQKEDDKAVGCDPPLRGGVRIQTRDEACTGGFMVRALSDHSTPYLLTAAHCLKNGTPNYFFGSGFTTPLSERGEDLGLAEGYYQVGAMTNKVFDGPDDGNDAGIIKIEQNTADLGIHPWVNAMNSGNGSVVANPRFTISGVGTSHVHQVLCFMGSRTGSHCGYVPKKAGFNGLTGRIIMCGNSNKGKVDHGDSGGPFVSITRQDHGISLGTANGTLISSALVHPCETRFQSVKTALSRLHVELVP